MKAEDALTLAMQYADEHAGGGGLIKKEYTVNLTGSNNWYALDANLNNDNVEYFIGTMSTITANNVVTFPNGYNDGYSNVQIYLANDSGLAFYGKSTAENATFKVTIYYKSK